MKLLFIMVSNPYSNDFNTLVKMSEAAKNAGHDTAIFFMGNGVYCLVRERIKELAENGIKVYYCAHNAEQRRIRPEKWAESSSMYGLAKLIKEYDKVLILN